MKDRFDQTVSTASATAADPGFALPQALLALMLAGRGERAQALRALAAAQAAVAAYLPRGMPFMGLPDVVSLLRGIGVRSCLLPGKARQKARPDPDRPGPIDTD